jgi:hypothetical protein
LQNAKLKKGDIIILETKYGKENRCIVSNLVAEKTSILLFHCEADEANVFRNGPKEKQRD